jgi:hypothetical protein
MGFVYRVNRFVPAVPCTELDFLCNNAVEDPNDLSIKSPGSCLTSTYLTLS